MSEQQGLDRRNFLVGTGTVTAASVLADLPAADASADEISKPPVIDPHAPLAQFWNKHVFELAQVDARTESPELARPEIRERHRIYCLLLMKLVERFWNGNKAGPVGTYPRRAQQKDSACAGSRYQGDRIGNPDSFRVNWDRYLGHNIGCLAVDGKGEIIDFEFNHNAFFRSTAEHAESRLVRRIFNLSNIADAWCLGERLPGKARSFSLSDVTIYTSLESCAQCSGVMSLGQVKQVVYLQRDPTTYVVGNIMYNLAGRDPSGRHLAPLPISADAVDVFEYEKLNAAYREFVADIRDAKKNDDRKRAFFISSDGTAVDYEPSITSFLCTDSAYNIFASGAARFDHLSLGFPLVGEGNGSTHWSNQECLREARRFYAYADFEGYRGSPHKA
jgi:tRNA(Arg) A34 adenosine deaminase TadA